VGGTKSLRKKEGSALSWPPRLAGMIVTRRSQDVLLLDCKILHQVSPMATAAANDVVIDKLQEVWKPPLKFVVRL